MTKSSFDQDFSVCPKVHRMPKRKKKMLLPLFRPIVHLTVLSLVLTLPDISQTIHSFNRESPVNKHKQYAPFCASAFSFRKTVSHNSRHNLLHHTTFVNEQSSAVKWKNDDSEQYSPDTMLLHTEERRKQARDRLHERTSPSRRKKSEDTTNDTASILTSQYSTAKHETPFNDKPDRDQLGSIQSTAPAILLRAGPGTGKSHALSARIAYLLKNHYNNPSSSEKCTPDQMVVLSFSNHDANALKMKAVNMLREDGFFDRGNNTEQRFSNRIWSGTIHAFAMQILRKYGDGGVKLCSSEEQRKRINQCLRQIMSSSSNNGATTRQQQQHQQHPRQRYYRALRDAGWRLTRLIGYVSRAIDLWKEAAILPPPDVYSTSWMQNGDEGNRKKEQIVRQQAMEVAIRLGVPESAALLGLEIFPNYQSLHASHNTADPSDLASMAYNLLSTSPSLPTIRSKLKHVIVDEYQDVSVSQHALLRLLLCGVEEENYTENCAIFSQTKATSSIHHTPSSYNVPNIFCAGDANQSIYGWRGAAPSLTTENFLKDYPQGVVVSLGVNYRLPRHILSAANFLLEGDDQKQSEITDSKEQPIQAFEVSPAGSLFASEIFWCDRKRKKQNDHRRQARLLGEQLLLASSSSSSDFDERNKVVIRELWDKHEEAKFIVSSIRKRSKERKKLCLSAMMGQDKELQLKYAKDLFDPTDVAIMVRTASQMEILKHVLDRFGIPFVVDSNGSMSLSSKRRFLDRNFHKKGRMEPVRLMTMHRAKGNEFNDVYLAGWEEGIFPHPSSVVSNRIHEERRLAYVALTRARQSVTITYAATRADRTRKNTEQVTPSRFLYELMPTSDEKQDNEKDSSSHFAFWSDKVGIKEYIAGRDLPNFFAKSYEDPNPSVNDRKMNGYDKFSIQQKNDPSANTIKANKKKNFENEAARDKDFGKTSITSQLDNSKTIASLPQISQEDQKHLRFIRGGIKNLYFEKRAKGIASKYRIIFRDMLKDIFGVTRGSALVILQEALVNEYRDEEEVLLSIWNADQSILTRRHLSKCTAKQLGPYIAYLIIQRNEETDSINKI